MHGICQICSCVEAFFLLIKITERLWNYTEILIAIAHALSTPACLTSIIMEEGRDAAESIGCIFEVARIK